MIFSHTINTFWHNTFQRPLCMYSVMHFKWTTWICIFVPKGQLHFVIQGVSLTNCVGEWADTKLVMFIFIFEKYQISNSTKTHAAFILFLRKAILLRHFFKEMIAQFCSQFQFTSLVPFITLKSFLSLYYHFNWILQVSCSATRRQIAWFVQVIKCFL